MDYHDILRIAGEARCGIWAVKRAYDGHAGKQKTRERIIAAATKLGLAAPEARFDDSLARRWAATKEVRP